VSDTDLAVALEQQAAPEQETAGVAQPQTDAAEQADPSPESEGKQELTEEQKTIRKLQRRIDRLTAGRGAAAREAELLREQLTQRQRAAETDDQEDDGRRIDPKDIDRIANERAQELVRRQQAAQTAGKVLEAGKKLTGFQEAVAALGEEVRLIDAKGLPTPFMEAVFESDKPAELLHYLGNNPEEAAAFANLTPAQTGRRLARLEDQLKQGAKSASSAPAPLRPVNARSAPGNLPSDDDDTKTWMLKEQARLAAKRKAYR
jgi:hypothetical protein